MTKEMYYYKKYLNFRYNNSKIRNNCGQTKNNIIKQKIGDAKNV